MTFRTAVRGAVLATTLALAPAASAFHDSGLPPDVVQALSELTQAAQMQCQSGNQQACGLAQQFQMTGNQLGQAAQACQAGNPQACQMYQVGVQNLSAYYQQYQMTNFAQQAPQGYGRTPEQHQQFSPALHRVTEAVAVGERLGFAASAWLHGREMSSAAA